MCRQGGYYDQAVYLAKKHGEHDLVVDVLIEDSKSYDNALDYIWRLEPDLAYPNLMKYARVLLEHCPKDSTQVFIDYYTGNYRPKKDLPLSQIPVVQGGVAIPLPSLSSFIPLAYRASPNVASPGTVGNQQATLSDTEAAGVEAAQPGPEYTLPKPRTAFPAFVDHSAEFIIFLEACLKQDYIDQGDLIDLYTTLFEMYLETASHQTGSEKETWEAKAKTLIDSKQVSPCSTLTQKCTDQGRRFQLMRPIFSCSLICLISVMAQFWSVNNKGYVLISSDLIPLPAIPKAQSRP